FRCFSWDGQNRQFSVPYQQITLHAISKDPGRQPMGDHTTATFSHPHLLVMIDGDRLWTPTLEQHTSNGGDTIPTEPMTIDETGSDAEDDLESEESNSGGRASDCPGETTILRFVPTDANVLDTMYTALAECQALNPDLSENLSPSDLEDVDEENEEYDAGTAAHFLRDQAAGDSSCSFVVSTCRANFA
ncbi:chloride channel, nucleotide-sensitive, 1A, partial [Paragonimus westermani]